MTRIKNKNNFKRELISRALSRLASHSQEQAQAHEYEIERDRKKIPWDLSVYALADYFSRVQDHSRDLEQDNRDAWLVDEKLVTIAAVSGGGDSVAMLWLLRAFAAGKIIVAHVNHNLRGAESDGDANFVQTLAHNWGLDFVTRDLDVRRLSATGESLELAARRLRHEALIDMASACGASLIALGHNRDDLAETVLFNLLRGSGIRGAIGIPERREKFFRPVLGLRREFLRELLRVRDIPWREDHTNQDPEIATRNFIRLELLPLIEKHVNSGAIEHLAAFAEEMRGVRSLEEGRAKDLLDGVTLAQPCTITDAASVLMTLNRRRAAALTDYERALVIRAVGHKFALPTLSRSRVNELSRLIARDVCDGPFVFQWGGNITVRGTRDTITVFRARGSS